MTKSEGPTRICLTKNSEIAIQWCSLKLNLALIFHPEGSYIQDSSPVRKRGVILILRCLETGVKEEIHTVYHVPFTKNIKPSFAEVYVHRYLIYFPSKLQNSVVKKLGNQNTFAKLPKMLLYRIWSLLAIRYFNNVW